MLALFLSVLALLCYFLTKPYRARVRRLAEEGDKIPGPKPLPLIGNALQFGTSTKDFFRYIVWLNKEHGPIARVWIGPELGVLLADPKYIEVVLGSSKLLDKSPLYRFGDRWLGQGMLTNTGSTWKRHRKLITPAFHVQILGRFLDTFNSNSQLLVKRLAPHVNGGDFDVFPYINLCTLDIICESAMGVKINAQEDSNSEYVKALRTLGDALFQRAFKPWLHPDFIFNISSLGKLQDKCLSTLHGVTKSVIATRKKMLSSEKSDANKHNEDDIGVKQRAAFLDMLIQAAEDGNALGDDELQNEVDTIMLARSCHINKEKWLVHDGAQSISPEMSENTSHRDLMRLMGKGHDTTTSALSFTCWLLAMHPHIQEKVVIELQEIFGDSDRPASSRDLQEMRYMEQVLKETLRLYPSVPIYGRIMTEDVPLDGYVLPSGCNVGVNPYMLHRHPDYFPDPEKFDPDRFLPENCVGRHPYCYIPFSAGPRNCLGLKFAMQEMKTTLSWILRAYKILPAERPELDLTVQLVLKSTTGVNIRLQRRG